MSLSSWKGIGACASQMMLEITFGNQLHLFLSGIKIDCGQWRYSIEYLLYVVS